MREREHAQAKKRPRFTAGELMPTTILRLQEQGTSASLKNLKIRGLCRADETFVAVGWPGLWEVDTSSPDKGHGVTRKWNIALLAMLVKFYTVTKIALHCGSDAMARIGNCLSFSARTHEASSSG